jgi:hypothetical protein
MNADHIKMVEVAQLAIKLNAPNVWAVLTCHFPDATSDQKLAANLEAVDAVFGPKK